MDIQSELQETIVLVHSMQTELSKSVGHSRIETAIQLFREVLKLLLVNACQDKMVFGLSDALITQFHLSGHSADLEEVFLSGLQTFC